MNYQEIYEEVQAIVKRPDRASAVDSAIKSAILKAHQSDFFYKDIKELAVQFDEARFIQGFIPSEIFPNYRKPKYIRAWIGDEFGQPSDFLTPIGIEEAMDNYGCAKTDVFYMAGHKLQIHSRFPIYRCLFGAYLWPVVTPLDSASSWIMDEFPFAIIYEAARILFLNIGFQEQSRGMQALVAEQYAALAVSNVDAVPQ